jgi:UDP-glucose 4-epimerase
VDNFDPYYDAKIKRHNIEASVKHPNYKFIELDIRNTSELTPLLKTESIKHVCHLAARPGVRLSLEEPNPYFEMNIHGTASLLEACRKSLVEKIVYASSSSVYGAANYLPIDEEHPTQPLSPYGVSKLLAEDLCRSYHRIYGLKTVVLRYFTVYGPRQRPDEAINKFLTQILKGKPITVYGDGNQRRDFTYVSDTIKATMLAIEKVTNNATLNIGSGKTHTVNELLEILEEVTSQKIMKRHIERHTADVEATWASIEKAKQVLGYRPEVNLKEGVKTFYNWLASNPTNN